MYEHYIDALREIERQQEVTQGRIGTRVIALDREMDAYYILSPDEARAAKYPRSDVTIIDG
jgi:hypothetical protein